MTEISLKCSCGTIQGFASSITTHLGIRIICCCDDCQAFAHYLDHEDEVLDEYGGTDIFQMPISHINITAGTEQIRCMRLSPKGMYRWYAACCQTPIGNTLSAGMPFIGMIHNFMDDAGSRDKNLGPVLGYVYTKYAQKALPDDRKQSAFPIGILMKSLVNIILWRLKGQHKPSPFFDANGSPVSAPHVLRNRVK